MRKIIGAIFGSQKNTETIVEGAVKGLDSMFFTKEEQAEYRQKGAEWFLEYLKATQPQNLARRLIALMVVALWSILILAGVSAWPWYQSYADYIFEVLAEVVMTPFLMIMGFYFAAHVVRSFADGKKR
jgi:hypothetical protein